LAESTSAAAVRAPDPDPDGDIGYPGAIPFALVHLACFAAIWTGIDLRAVIIGAVLYGVRMFGVTAGYHRYFSHRAFRLGRVAQFVLAFLAQASAQKSVLWWAAHHRHHHRYSDTPEDLHAPRHGGFWRAHLGWVFMRRNGPTDLVKIQDFARYPELMWLHRLELAPAILTGGAAFLIGGWSGLVVGFFWSTVLLYHATFCINSLAHVRGRKRYVTGDDSRNNWALALITFGEGWHNNHHAYQSSARQGFRWWEIDLSFYALKALSWIGIVRDIRNPPVAVLRNEQKLTGKVIERSAHDVAASFHVERIVARVRAALPEMRPRWADPHALHAELHEALHAAHRPAAELLAHLNIPALPTHQDIRQRAAAMLAKSPSLDDIVEQAHRLVLERVCARLEPAS
jgi:stearoyl-CoA desaturase (delta-9 desaturase)